MKTTVWQGLIQKRLARHFRVCPRHSAEDLGRRGFLQRAAGAAGLALSSGLCIPRLAHSQIGSLEPKPIPGGAAPLGILVHHYPLPSTPVPLSQINDPSEIGDFNGVIGDTQIRGGGTGTGFTQTLAFRADMGFMQGEYVSEAGEHHQGTFVFV